MPPVTTPEAVRLAVDIGGTFTDVVLETPQARFSAKVLTTKAAPEEGVLDGMLRALKLAKMAPAEVGLIVHGTTLATNAIIERKGARTALVVTEGFRDSIEIAFEHRFEQYDIFMRKPTPLVPRELRFLIVEDDFTCRVLVSEYLRKYGPFHVAINGTEAVHAVRVALDEGRPYDLICLDIMMPEMDGQYALKLIRQSEEAKGILSSDGAKIIMTTALGSLDHVKNAYASLCDGYLVKPLYKAKLEEELRKLGLLV